ncbi:site-specific integrase [Pseudomonas sp.]|uniref:site-specific integrase n=1 Tax=Pseudomonas sp. TaxID=306 RepID=UPI0032674C61
MTLLVPGWLVQDLRIYVNSEEAKKRRARSFYRESADNYVFLSNNGVPYYTSKQELVDRRNKSVNEYAGLVSRAEGVAIQDGGSLRKHIREMLVPLIRRESPNFQDFTFHDLRATFGMNLLESQLSHLGEQNITSALEYVRQRMGHANIITTMQYLQYKSRLKWKNSVQHEFESKLFEHVSTSANVGGLV